MSNHGYRPRAHPAPPSPDMGPPDRGPRQVSVDVDHVRELLGFLGLTLHPTAGLAGIVLVALTTAREGPIDEVYPEPVIFSFLDDPTLGSAMAVLAIKALAPFIE